MNSNEINGLTFKSDRLLVPSSSCCAYSCSTLWVVSRMHEEHGTQTSFIITPCPCQRCSPPRRGPLRPAPSKLDHVVGGRRNDELAPPLHHRAAQVERRLHAGSRPRRTPRSRPVFGFRPRRYAAATVSAVSGRPGKASGGHRKDARGMSITGLSMAAHPCCTREDVEAGVQPRVSTGRSIHAVPSITPSPREGIEDGPRLRARTRSNQSGRGPTRGPRAKASAEIDVAAVTVPVCASRRAC